MEWSPGAIKALEDYCQHVRGDVAAAGYEGADPDEVADDIRHHVEVELQASGASIVTREDVERAVQRIGLPAALEGSNAGSWIIAPEALEPTKSEPTPWRPQLPGPVGVNALAVCGVVLPVVTLLFELGSGMCAEGYFDPLPTIGHAIAIALVPIANGLALFHIYREGARERSHLGRLLGILNAAALVIAFYYAILFLPLLPLAVIGIAFAGMGLLPLSPLLGLIATLRLRSWIRKATPWTPTDPREETAPPRVPGLIAGLALGLGFLTAINATSTLTGIGLRMASSSETSTSQRGIRFLRSFGSERELLKRCYGQPQSATGLMALLMDFKDPVLAGEARGIYYRVTGRPFNAAVPASGSLREDWLTAPAPFMGGDVERGGDEVGGRSRGLELASSRLDAQIDAGAAFAYTEWTLSFKNRSALESLEARALLALPPGGVVSRLTLWIEGEEREAAFAARSEVRKAYEEVVRARRDPVLVTSAGVDRVLMQCFPVLPGGGVMKVRIGITAPLGLTGSGTDATRAHLGLPSFVERNFAVLDVEHAVWIESHSPLDPGDTGLIAQQPSEGRFALRGGLNDPRLSDSGAFVHVRRDHATARSWTPVSGRDPIEQVIRREPIEAATRIILVIDGSRAMAPHAPALADALEALPTGIECTVLFAADSVETAIPLELASARIAEQTRASIESFTFVGGRDAVPALIAALDLAVGHEGARVLWVHGPQPVELRPMDALMQYADRCGEQRLLFDMQIAPGPNVIARELAKRGALLAAPRRGAWVDDLSSCLAVWGAGGERFVIDRAPLAPAVELPGVAPASLHVARLWAADEVERLVSSGRDPSTRAAAVALAVQHQLVTSVTGAVVLENEGQYKRAGLEVVDAATVPIVPEPELILIVVLAAVVALGSFLTRRRRTHRGVPA